MQRRDVLWLFAITLIIIVLAVTIPVTITVIARSSAKEEDESSSSSDPDNSNQDTITPPEADEKDYFVYSTMMDDRLYNGNNIFDTTTATVGRIGDVDGDDDDLLHRVFIYGDVFVGGECGYQCREPIGPLLQAHLQQRDDGTTPTSTPALENRAEVSYFAVGPIFAADMMARKIHSDRLGMTQHLKRVGPQVVVLWAGYFDIATSQDLVASFSKTVVLEAIQTMAETALSQSSDVRFVVIVGIPLTPSGYASTTGGVELQRQHTQLINAELKKYADSKQRVFFQPLPDMFYDEVAVVQNGGVSPYYLSIGGANRFSRLGYETIVDDYLGPLVRELLEKPFRVVGYGDSLTWGSPGPYPYNIWMQPRLQQHYGLDLISRRWGIPGMKAVDMLNRTMYNEIPYSLRHQLQFGAEGDPIDVLILLAGTNDLLNRESWDIIDYTVKQLHEVAFEEDVRFSMNLDLPGSQFEINNPALYAVAHDQLRSSLQNIPNPRIVWTPFPFEFERGNALWADNIHPSAWGYQVMGEYLADQVYNILTQRKRIFCFGDDFITGFTAGTWELFSFCESMETSLLGKSGTGYYDAVVSHTGKWQATATELYALESTMDWRSTYSLSSLLSSGYPAMDIVIIVVGTFDIMEETSTADTIASAIIGLHLKALDECNAKNTIVVGVPPSRTTYNNVNGEGDKRDEVNRDLAAWAATDPRTTWVPFPFEYDPSSTFWSSDGIRPSAAGYEELETALEPLVQNIFEAAATTESPSNTPSILPSTEPTISKVPSVSPSYFTAGIPPFLGTPSILPSTEPTISKVPSISPSYFNTGIPPFLGAGSDGGEPISKGTPLPSESPSSLPSFQPTSPPTIDPTITVCPKTVPFPLDETCVLPLACTYGLDSCGQANEFVVSCFCDTNEVFACECASDVCTG